MQTQYVAKIFDLGRQVYVVYTDFVKVFDKLSHSLLLQKLNFSRFSHIFLIMSKWENND